MLDRMTRRSLHTLAAVALLSLALPAARAGVFRAASVEEAARSSDAVVRGVVQRQEGRLLPGGRRIVTDVEIAVSSAWKGAPGTRIVVTVPGGRADGLVQWSSAAPVFGPGEEVVLFLAHRASEWRVNGLALGKFRVDGPIARPAVEPSELVAAPLKRGEAKVAEMTVAELERRVRAAR
jgi:hypothetical protein